MLLQLPVPRDVPLGLPLPEWLLVSLLIVSFLLHILFVNLMVGGSILTLWYEIKGLKNKSYDLIAREIAATITVNKSVAVVLGVAPLLCINVLYTVYFYSSNALTGLLWIAVVPWVTVVFLLLYTHKYTWEKLADNKPLHISIISFAILSFLFIPFIFLSNINLMLFPERWHEIRGFFSTISLPNVFPRFLHFLTATFAVTGLFLTWYFGRKGQSFKEKLAPVSIYEVRKKMYSLALGATALQFIFGPFLFLTLPVKGIDWNLFLYIGIGVLLVIIGIYYMWNDIFGPRETFGKNFYKVVVILSLTVIFMGTGRQVYRSNALDPHRELMAEKTKKHHELIMKMRQEALKADSVSSGDLTPGKLAFNTNCAMCHLPDMTLVGPPINEIVEIYQGNKSALKQWIRKPGRKRMELPAMTGFPDMEEEKLDIIAEYILKGMYK